MIEIVLDIMKLTFDYLTSMAIGLFVGSLILFMGRILGFPISSVLLGLIFSSLLTAFLYNPSNKKESKHRALRGTGSSFLFAFIFAVAFTIYYIPKFNGQLLTADLSLTASILIILVVSLIGGIIIGSIAGSIGKTLRDICSVIVSKKSSP